MGKGIRLLGLVVALTCLYGCTTTVKPVKVQASVASFDGTNQNSGILSFDKSNQVGIVTGNWRARYNLLILDYGKKFKPWLVADYGLIAKPDGTWIATSEALVNMGKMELWRRNNIK